MPRFALSSILLAPLLVVWFARADSSDGGAVGGSHQQRTKRVRDGGVADAASGTVTGALPDPQPLVTRHQWVIDLVYERGGVILRGSRRLSLGRPTATPRMMGRFALELYVGRELLDRVRFDFPLLGASDYEAEPGGVFGAPPSFEKNLTSSAAVMLPHSERATRLVLVDRGSGRTWDLLWPPHPLPAAADGGTASR